MVFGILEANGANTGPFLGIPPTSRRISIDVFEYFHFVDPQFKDEVLKG